MILPRRCATSRHKSFSINPVGPIVPVSWPPCPASITMRLIFRPSVRVNVDCPSRVGSAALAGRIKSGFAPSDFAFFRDFPPRAVAVVALSTKLELRGPETEEPLASEPVGVTAVPAHEAGGPKGLTRAKGAHNA